MQAVDQHLKQHSFSVSVCQTWRHMTLSQYWFNKLPASKTVSGLNLPLSYSSTTSRELLSQFSTWSGWKRFDVVYELKKIAMSWEASFMEIFIKKPLFVEKLSLFSGM